MIQGSAWFDAVQLLTSNENLTSTGRVQLRKVPIQAPDGTEIKYEPDYHRTYGKVRFLVCSSPLLQFRAVCTCEGSSHL